MTLVACLLAAGTGFAACLYACRARSSLNLVCRRIVAAEAERDAVSASAAQSAEESAARSTSALNEAQSQLEQFIAFAPASIAMIDRDLRFVAHTRRFATECGFDRHDLAGWHVSDILPSLGLDWPAALAECMAGSLDRRDEKLLELPGGATRWILWKLRPWHAADGSPAGLMLMTKDITERKAMMLQLSRALSSAEAAARAKADFLATMSHELRTPLTGIIGMAESLLADSTLALSPGHRQMIDMQRRCGTDLLTIVNDILDFSKADSGHLQLEAIPVGIRDLVESSLATIAPAAEGKSIATELTIDPALPDAIAGDPVRLRQILLNFLSNAAKFTPVGGHIGLAVSPSGGGIRFSVSDTGVGISPDALPHLFTRFSQADASTSRHYGGTGLGLAICRQMVELMNGSIEVESEPGIGSTFSFTIPIRPAAQQPQTPVALAPVVQAQPAAPTDAAAAPPAVGRPAVARHILVAEDNGTNRLLVSKMLEKQGCRVSLVADGRAAVEAVTRPGAERFDLVLMDIHMPIMDGEEATRQIRACEAGRRTPIVALTANAFSEDIARYRALGMDDHIAKPIDWPLLFSTLDRLANASVGIDDLPVLDHHTLAELRSMFGADAAQELVDLFAVELESRTAALSGTAAAAALAVEAHALASAAKSIGCAELSRRCKELERKITAGSDDIGTELAAILAAAARAGDAIRREAGQIGAAA
ncbi:MAG: ATP-binding protein [Ancalomicrobiaceae bacterium]|nr:ATP-binding protein [Ancalomicrobiaceae bacterium]